MLIFVRFLWFYLWFLPLWNKDFIADDNLLVEVNGKSCQLLILQCRSYIQISSWKVAGNGIFPRVNQEFTNEWVNSWLTRAKTPFADTFHDEMCLLYDSLVWSPRFRFWQLAMFTLLEVIALSFTSLRRNAFFTPSNAMFSPMFLDDVADYHTIEMNTIHQIIFR